VEKLVKKVWEFSFYGEELTKKRGATPDENGRISINPDPGNDLDAH